MKNISLIINGVLAIAVAILFYQVHSLKNGVTVSSEKSSSEVSVKPTIIASAENLADAKIAYVNMDTLNLHYLKIADYSKDMNRRKTSLESQMQSMTAKFQQDYEAFQQSAQAGIATQGQLEKQKQDLERQQQELANKELQLQNLGIEMEEKTYQLNTDLREFLKKFNNNKFDYILSFSEISPALLLVKPELDVTAQVLKGLNDDYTSKKKK